MAKTIPDKELESDEAFTNDELIRALQDASIDEDDGDVMTTAELADVLGISHRMTLRRIKHLLKEGTLEPAQKRFTDCTGRDTKTFGYRLKT